MPPVQPINERRREAKNGAKWKRFEGPLQVLGQMAVMETKKLTELGPQNIRQNALHGLPLKVPVFSLRAIVSLLATEKMSGKMTFVAR